MARVPLHPKHPERICWGCDKYCPATDLRCGNGTIRTQHPVELFGDDWTRWEPDSGSQDSNVLQSKEMEQPSSEQCSPHESATCQTQKLLGLGIPVEYAE